MNAPHRHRRCRPRAAFVFLLAASVVGCAPLRAEPPLPPPLPPPATAEWPEVRSAVHEAAARGAYARADSLLVTFAERYPTAAESADARYWRAVLLLDPANDSGSALAAITVLDEYMAAGPSRTEFVTARVLRRLAQRMDSLRSVEAPPPAGRPAGLVPRDSLRVRDEEIARMRTELDQTKEELERLRRRLVVPRPRRP